MGFSRTYKPLLEVRIIHDFFLNKRLVHFLELEKDKMDLILSNYNIWDWMEIVPCEKTKIILQNHKAVMRKTHMGYVVYILSVDGSSSGKYKPYLPFSDNQKLNFNVRIKDNLFTNYTNIPIHNQGQEILYYGNGNKVNSDFPYLSEKIVGYTKFKNNLSGEFEVGTLVRKSNVIYEARKKSSIVNLNDNTVWRKIQPDKANFSNGNAYAVGDVVSTNNKRRFYKAIVDLSSGATNVPASASDEWELIGKLPISYTSVDDVTSLYPLRFRYKATNPSIKDMDLSFTVTDLDGNMVTDAIFEVDDNGEGLLDVSPLQSGLYTITITDGSSYNDTVTGYFSDAHPKDNTVAAIELYLNPTATNYRLVESGNLTNPVYEIHFLNRYTNWKYIDSESQVILKEESLTLPITRFGYLDISHDGDQLPNPDAGMIIPDTNKIYSEIYL